MKADTILADSREEIVMASMPRRRGGEFTEPPGRASRRGQQAQGAGKEDQAWLGYRPSQRLDPRSKSASQSHNQCSWNHSEVGRARRQTSLSLPLHPRTHDEKKSHLNTASSSLSWDDGQISKSSRLTEHKAFHFGGGPLVLYCTRTVTSSKGSERTTEQAPNLAPFPASSRHTP